MAAILIGCALLGVVFLGLHELRARGVFSETRAAQPLGLFRSTRAGILAMVGLVAVVVLVWLLVPAFEGFHIGHDVWTDHECLSRIVQWCK
jgi:hypothetical protein